MKIPRFLASAFITSHLVIVALGASHTDYSKWGKPGLAVAYYSALTGADTGYSFFVPGVGPQFRARFLIEDQQGQISTDALEKGKSQEITTKIENLVLLLWETLPEKDLQRSVAASLVAKMFQKHSEAKEITVVYQIFDPPPMADFVRYGTSPSWKTIYEATFRHDSKSQKRLQ